MTTKHTNTPQPMVHGPLRAVMDRLRAALGELDSLSQRQGALIDGEDPGPLLDLMARRQQAAERLGAAARDLEPLRQEWERHRHAASAGTREEIDSALVALAGAASTILQRDEADGARLARRREELLAALHGVERSRTAVGAYGPTSSASGPSVQDREA